MNPDSILLEPFYYLKQHPGKEIRSLLIKAFEKWLPLSPNERSKIQEIVEMLHTASLMIDDVEDDSSLRRGVPVCHKIYGIPSTINSANFVYFLALEKVLELNKPSAVHMYTKELLQLHRGQGMELFWRDSHHCPSESEFLDMVQNKTGGLLRLAVGLMQSCCPSDKDYSKLVNLLGIHFQIRDDFMNLQSDQVLEFA